MAHGISMNSAQIRTRPATNIGDFALVPRREDGDVRWQRHNLSYAGSTRRIVGSELYSGRPQKHDDLHRLRLRGIDAQAVQELGIAFGAQTNVGTVWAQSLGANFFVEG